MALTGHRTPFIVKLDTNGDQTGSTDANVNGSVTPVVLKYTAQENQPVELHRMLIFVRDSLAFAAEDYGNVTGPLTNGITIAGYDPAGNLVTNTGGVKTIVSNADWSRLCFDTDYLSYGSGDNYLAVRWTFAKTGEAFNLPAGAELRVTINDDLSGLVQHEFEVQGVILGYRF